MHDFSSWLRKTISGSSGTLKKAVSKKTNARLLSLEQLENRVTPSSVMAKPDIIVLPSHPNYTPYGGQGSFYGLFAPSDIETAYGLNPLYSQGYDGTGETIALIDAYDDPYMLNSTDPNFDSSDLHTFDQQFGLPDPPSFTKYGQINDSNTFTSNSSTSGFPSQNSGWEGEEALDVEWAHSIAPGANIMLVEADAANGDLDMAVDWAAKTVANGGGGANVVSMSYGSSGGYNGETSDDSTYAPLSYPSVTFLASSDDDGSINPYTGNDGSSSDSRGTGQAGYPSDSPNVVSVGGTALTVVGGGNFTYQSESVWNDGSSDGGQTYEATGGGISNFESQPAYQASAAAPFSTTKRTAPDISFLADPDTGVVFYDDGFGGVGGTSLSSPCWAGIVAIADQVRANAGESALGGPTQALPILYNLYGSSAYSNDFHDVTTGNNGTYSAGMGYDLATGIGTPIASNLVPDLADVGQLIYTAPSGTNSFTLKENSGVLDLTDNGTLVDSQPASATTSITIDGGGTVSSAANNSLTIDFGGGQFSIPVTFDGGAGNAAHPLTLKNGTFTSATYTLSGAHSGSINLDGQTITFSRTSSVANTGTAANDSFVLPAGAQASLQDDGTSGNGISEITSTNTGFVTTTFSNPAASLAVTTAGSSSLVQLAGMDSGFAPTSESFSGQAGDTFRLKVVGAVPSNTSVTLATATLDINGLSPTINALAGSGTITSGTSGALTLTIGHNGGSGIFSGVLQNGSATLSLVKAGSGTETLSGANTYGGTTTISAGTLAEGIANALPTGTALSDSGTLDLAGFSQQIASVTGGGIVTDSGAAAGFTLSNSLADTFAGTLTGALALTKISSGTLTLTGASTFGGATTISAGSLVEGVANALPTGTALSNSGTLDLAGFNQQVASVTGSGAVTDSGAAATFTVNNSSTDTFAGTLTGNLALAKTGGGALTLSSANTYGGATTISAGSLIEGIANTLPTGTALSDSGTLDLAGFSQQVASLTGNGIVTDSAAAATFTLSNSSADTFAGTLTGALALTKISSGTLTLTGASTFGGATTISAGSLVEGVANALPTGTALSNSGTLDLAGFNQQVASATGSGTVTDSGAAATFTVNNSSTDSLAGKLTGNVALAKSNGGTLVLTGTSIYAGSTIVLAGTLEVDGSITSAVNLSGSSILDGTGTTGAVTASGSTLAPGKSAPGILSTGALDLQAGSALNVLIGGNSAGSYSQDNVISGTVTLDTTGSGVLLNLSALSYTPKVGETYVLIANGGGSAVSGTFVAGAGVDAVAAGTALPEGALLSANFLGSGLTAFLTYQAGSNHDSVAVVMASLTVSIGNPSALYAASGPISYTVTYNDIGSTFKSSTLTTANVHLVSTNGATGTLSFDNGTGASRTVTISNISGDGTLGIVIDAGSGIDLAGNLATASLPSATFTVDNTAPTITISAPSALYAAGGPITYTVSYADTNFKSSSLTSNNITLNTSDTASGTVSVSGSDTSYTVSISNITGDGTLGFSIAGGTAVDQAGNQAAASAASATFTVDNTAPAITIGAPSALYAAGGPITYTVTYNDTNFKSSNLTASDITLNEKDSARGTVSVSGSGTSYTVTVSGISGDGSLGISIAGGTAVDQAGNQAPASAASATFTVDNTAPTITIGAPSTLYAAGGPITYTVSYADANFKSSSLTSNDITLNTSDTASGTVSVSGSGTSYTVTVSGITGDGSLGISIAGGTAVDQAGNQAAASAASATFTVDNTAPAITIGAPSALYAAGGPITYTVTYADANFKSSSLTTSNITLNTSDSATGTVSVSGSGTSYTVTISGISGDGSLGISIAGGTAVDQAGNQAPASAASATFTVDNTAPTITIGAPSALYAAGGPITYTVTYADANFKSSNLTSNDITLNEKETASGTVSVSGSGTSYTVTVSGITGDGSLGISITGGTAVDQAGNEAPASASSTTFIVDNTPPSVTIGAPSALYTAGGPITYTVPYADANFKSSSLTSNDITLNTSDTASGTVSVSGSDTSYTVTISNISGDGSLGISIAGGTAVDQAGNQAPASAASTMFTVDNTAPTISIDAPSALYAAGGPITYTVTYADTNFKSSNLTASDITLNEKDSARGTVSVSGSGTSYTVTVSGISGDGSLGISIAGGTAVDQAGNQAPASAASATFTVDNTDPTVAIGSPSKSIIASGSIAYSFTYSDANFGTSSLTASDITLNSTGGASGIIGLTGSGTSYTVTISNITGDGTLGISVPAGTAVDLAGNQSLASAPSTTFIVDNTPPSISVGSPSAAYAVGGPITYTINYADANFKSSSLTSSAITLNVTGTASGTLSVSGSGTTYTVTIGDITGDGSLGISVAGNTAVDLAGNKAASSGPSSTFIVDNTAPTVTIDSPSSKITTDGQITYAITYKDTNFKSSSLTASDITLNTTGTANGTIGLTGSGTSYTVTISGISGDGSLGISIAGGTAVDQAGNQASASAASTMFTVDNTPPSVKISNPSSPIISNGSIVYTISYADANFASSNLNTGDITLNKTGTAGGVVSLSGSGQSYTVTITNIIGDGTLGISIAANTGVDLAGNQALAAGPSNTFIVDNTAPTITLDAPSASYTAGGPITYKVTYDDVNFDSSNLTTSDITLNKTGLVGGTVSVSGSDTSYTVTISRITGNGTLGISVAGSTAVDQAGNEAPASGPSTTFVVDNIAPTMTIESPSASITTGGPMTYKVTYADANFKSSSLSAAGVILNKTGTANGSISVSGSDESFTVTIGNITGDGTLGISIPAGSAVDLAGNKVAAAGPTATFIVDNTPPSISISNPSTMIISGGTILYAISYDDDNFGSSSLTASDITLNTTGTASGTLSLSGSGTSYSVNISGISGDGTLSISVAGGTAVDQAGNEAAAAGSAKVFVDNTAPSVTIDSPSEAYTANGPITYTITYADANFRSSSLTNSDILLNETGTADGTVAVTGAGTTYTVTISDITGDGSLGIAVAPNTAVDLAGNEASSSNNSATFVVDNTLPTLTIGKPSASLTTHGPISYSVIYADTNFKSCSLTASDISLTSSDTATGTVSVSGSGTSYTVTISNITGDGLLGFSIAAGSAVDQAGNLALGADARTPFAVDNTPPAVVISDPSVATTTHSALYYAVNYSDAYFASSSLTVANITLNKTGTASGVVSVSGLGVSYIVTIGNISGDGTLGISIGANTAVDQIGNKALAVGPSATVLVDNTAPTIALSSPSASTTAHGSVSYSVTYADTNFLSSTLTTSDVHLIATGTATGTLYFDNSNGTKRTITIGNITGDGTLGIAIDAGSAVDSAGNQAPAPGIGAAFLVDNTPPTVHINAPSVKTTVAGPVKFTVTYLDAHLVASSISLTPADIVLNSLNPNLAATITVSGSGTSRTVTVSGITGGRGTLGITIVSGTATDIADNQALGSFPSTTFNVTGAVKLALASTVATTVIQGNSLVYTFTVVNKGTQQDTGVMLQQTLPAGVTVSLANNPGWTAGANGTDVFSVGTLKAGASRKVTFKVTTAGATVNSILADAISDLDSFGVEGSATVKTTVKKAPSRR